MPDDGGELAGLLEGVRQRDQKAARDLVERLYPLVRKIVGAHRPLQMAKQLMKQHIVLKIRGW